MAIVEPFQGVHYNIEKVNDLSKVVAPPYDVISQADQEAYYARHPQNIIRLILGKDLHGDDSQTNKYTRAAAYFTQWIEEGILVKDERPAFYLCEDTYVSGTGTKAGPPSVQAQDKGRERKRRSLIARVRLEEWGEGGIYPHEETMPGPKADRLRLMRACKANLSSILTLYPDERGSIGRFLDAHTPSKPIAKASDNGISSTLWKVDDPEVTSQIHTLMADQPLFVADGHHRYETALNYMKETAPTQSKEVAASFAMMTCVSMNDPGLEVLPTHRLVKGAPDVSVGTLKQKLKEHFDIIPLSPEHSEKTERSTVDILLTEMERLSIRQQAGDEISDSPPPSPQQFEGGAKAAVFGLYCGSEREGPGCFLLRLKPDAQIQSIIARAPNVAHPPSRPASSEWQKLDVNVLHLLILPMAFGLPLSANIGAESIGYTRDPQFVVKSVDTGDYQLGFFLNATLMSQLRCVAIRGERMPPKSTYFYPKLLSGLVINQFKEA